MIKPIRLKRCLGFLLAGSFLMASAVPVTLAETTQVESYRTMTPQRSTTQTTTTTMTGQHTMVIPAGTPMKLRSMCEGGQCSGNRYMAQVIEPVRVQGMTVIPAGSTVRGDVVSVNDYNRTMDVNFREVSTTTGETVPIRSKTTVNMLYGGVQTQGPTGLSAWVPRVGPRRHDMSPGAKIVAGTAGGAVFGGAVGTLSGLLEAGINDEDVNYNEGTGALRGLGWGAMTGAGLGLVTGLVAAALDRDDTTVTTTRTSSVSTPTGLTNITTGSLEVEERPVVYTSGAAAPVGTVQEFTIRLEQPVTVIMMGR